MIMKSRTLRLLAPVVVTLAGMQGCETKPLTNVEKAELVAQEMGVNRAKMEHCFNLLDKHDAILEKGPVTIQMAPGSEEATRPVSSPPPATSAEEQAWRDEMAETALEVIRLAENLEDSLDALEDNVIKFEALGAVIGEINRDCPDDHDPRLYGFE